MIVSPLGVAEEEVSPSATSIQIELAGVREKMKMHGQYGKRKNRSGTGVRDSDRCVPFSDSCLRQNVSRSLTLSGFVLLALCGLGVTGLPARERSNDPADTTSGNFEWTVDTIGADGSTLYDCCIVNDTLAYAVGWIMPHDPAQQSHTLDWYNAAVWNGKKWTPMQVPVFYKGRKTFSPIHSVFARNKDDVWFGMYYMVHWNGHEYSQVYPRIRSWENKIWESPDGSRLYAVGDYGVITFSSDSGRSWTPIQTGTMLPYQDVWGNGGQVLAVASDDNGHQYLVSLIGDDAVHLADTFPFARSLSGVWFVPQKEYLLVGSGIYRNNNLGIKTWLFDPSIWRIKHYATAVRGNAANDVVIAGLGGTVAHWNGRDWRSYPGIENAPDRLRALSMNGDVVIAVGQRYFDNIHNCGVIYTGIRHVLKAKLPAAQRPGISGSHHAQIMSENSGRGFVVTKGNR